MQPSQLGTFQYNTYFINSPTYTTTFAYNYYGVIYSSGICTITLPVGTVPKDEGRVIVISDEIGGVSSYGRGIVVQGSGGQLINGNSSVTMKLERMSLSFLFRNNSWKIV